MFSGYACKYLQQQYKQISIQVVLREPVFIWAGKAVDDNGYGEGEGEHADQG